ncbi:MAG: glycosyltransferase, partial [Romboutsia sp.]|nr:glycosyltransferase [Romboutsia sp.]
MNSETQYKYKFSIVTAIYNVEKYLEEAILSVVNQDIGFEENVQLILVNDGSPDKSGIICEKYKELYPNNIVYIEKENGGVSSARNEGMKYIEGKYMNFLDADDKLEINVLSTVYNFFEKIYEYTDVVSIPVHFFEVKQGEHLLNYKYKRTRQINLSREYKNIQMFINSTFIKSEFKDKFKFNVNMKYAEDAELVNKILLAKKTMGVVKQTKYWYRIREDASSAVQTGDKRKEWYIDNLRYFSLGMIKYCIETKGYVPEFIQHMIMYDLQWRFRVNEVNESVLNESEKKEFMSLIKQVLKYIDNEIIIGQRNITTAHKLYILKLKNEEKFNLKLISSPNNIEIMLNGSYIDSICNENIRIDLIDVKDGYLHIEGAIGKLLPKEKYEVIVYINDEEFSTEIIDRSINNEKSLGDVIKEIQGFKCNIPINFNSKEQVVKVYLRIKNSLIRPSLTLGKFVMINKDLSNSYFATETHRVVFKYNSFILLKNSFKVNFGREYRLISELLKRKQRKIVCIRMLYFLSNLIKRKKVWLFMDRTDKADDNAEHLYKYSLKQRDNIKKYYVIKKDSPDFERIKKYGNVVPY